MNQGYYVVLKTKNDSCSRNTETQHGRSALSHNKSSSYSSYAKAALATSRDHPASGGDCMASLNGNRQIPDQN